MEELKVKKLVEEQIASEKEAWIEIIHKELSKKFQSTDKLNFCPDLSLIYIKHGEKQCKIYIGLPSYAKSINLGSARPSVAKALLEQLKKEGFSLSEKDSHTICEVL